MVVTTCFMQLHCHPNIFETINQSNADGHNVDRVRVYEVKIREMSGRVCSKDDGCFIRSSLLVWYDLVLRAILDLCWLLVKWNISILFRYVYTFMIRLPHPSSHLPPMGLGDPSDLEGEMGEKRGKVEKPQRGNCNTPVPYLSHIRLIRLVLLIQNIVCQKGGRHATTRIYRASHYPVGISQNVKTVAPWQSTL
jgi:hypothetical protein